MDNDKSRRRKNESRRNRHTHQVRDRGWNSDRRSAKRRKLLFAKRPASSLRIGEESESEDARDSMAERAGGYVDRYRRQSIHRREGRGGHRASAFSNQEVTRELSKIVMVMKFPGRSLLGTESGGHKGADE